ncbi:tetratricopeptide repeat protein [Candidatus Micrarchaeota archaeon]|nr:tetratricopeptide repeat protein [Candidatus Micrarchaeota archaeon]
MKTLMFNQETMPRGRHTVKPKLVAGAAAATLFFISCTTMAEPVRKDTTPQPAQNAPAQAIRPEETPMQFAQVGTAQVPKPAKKQGYDTSIDPFSLNGSDIFQKLGLSGDSKANVQRIFSQLRIGGEQNLKTEKRPGKQPRTAVEALEKGGDCSDLTNLVIGVLKTAGVPGGAFVVHFKVDPPDLLHMIAYAEIEGKKVIIDPQATELGRTTKGKYELLFDVDYDQARAFYHREYGDYFARNDRKADAIKAYERAVELFDGDPNVHYNLGLLYGKSGDDAKASQHLKRAEQLNPGYAVNKKITDFNTAVEEGIKAIQEGRWADCIFYMKAALRLSAEASIPLPNKQKEAMEENVKACTERQ